MSIITPVYQEQQGLAHYFRRVRELFQDGEEVAYEFLLVDDGSTDATWQRMLAEAQGDPRFRLIRLARNLGSHVAIAAGLDHSRGDALAILAADLQDPPEVVLEFMRRWREGTDIVWGSRLSRAEPFVRIWVSRVFYRLLRHLAMPRGSLFTTGSFLLMDRRVRDYVCQFREQNRLTFAMVAWTGFEQTRVEYQRLARRHGRSGWSYARMIRTFYDALLGFSYAPIRLISLLGIALGLVNIPLMLGLALAWWSGHIKAIGWTSTMVTVIFFSSVQLVVLGLVCEYLYRVHQEGMRRPLYFIAASRGLSPEGGE